MVRKIVFTLSFASKWTFLALIRAYQKIVSPFFGYRCRFYPSCSHYAFDAITSHHVIKGLYLTCRRILRCHPFHKGGFDPVPK